MPKMEKEKEAGKDKKAHEHSVGVEDRKFSSRSFPGCPRAASVAVARRGPQPPTGTKQQMTGLRTLKAFLSGNIWDV